MKILRAKNLTSHYVTSKTSVGAPRKKNPIASLWLPIVLLIFLSSVLPGCQSSPSITPHLVKGQATVASHKIRLTPRDYLLGIDKNHAIVQAVNNMTDDVLKGNRMTARIPIKENGINKPNKSKWSYFKNKASFAKLPAAHPQFS